jgi:hypothetical protein
MKKLLAIIAVLIVSNEIMAQKIEHKDLPKHITKAFSEKFPNGEHAKWASHHDGYQVKFKQDQKQYTAYYTPDGQWKGTESPIKWTKNLPDKVKDGWAKSGHYDWYVHGIGQLQTPGGEQYVLRVNNSPLLDANHIDAHQEFRVLYFMADGTLVKTDRG